MCYDFRTRKLISRKWHFHHIPFCEWKFVIEIRHPDLFFPFQIYKKEMSFPRVDGTEFVVSGTKNDALLYVLSTNEGKNEALQADRNTVAKVGRKFVVTIASEYQLILGKDLSVTVGFPSQRAIYMELWCFRCCQQAVEKNPQKETTMCRWFRRPLLCCRQATSHGMIQRWLRPLSPYFDPGLQRGDSLTPMGRWLSSISPRQCHGRLARYVKLRVAHAPGMFSPPLTSNETTS